MIINRRFNFTNDKKITAQKADNINDFIWIAFSKNNSDVCIITKSAKFYPTQTYFSLERAVTEIVAMDLDSTKLYIAYEDSALLGEIISKTNPLTSTTEISKGDIVESPIDVVVNGTDLWYLLPGNASGTNAQLLKYNLSGVLQDTIDLEKSGLIINNAKSMAIDANDDIWIVTYENPVRLIRVYEISGGTYNFESIDIS